MRLDDTERLAVERSVSTARQAVKYFLVFDRSPDILWLVIFHGCHSARINSGRICVKCGDRESAVKYCHCGWLQSQRYLDVVVMVDLEIELDGSEWESVG